MTAETQKQILRELARLIARRETARKDLASALSTASKESADLAALILAGKHGASACAEFGLHVKTCAATLQRIESEITGAEALAERLS